MRLPFQQVAMEVIELVAPELAVALDWTEEGAGWGIIHLHKWALARCPEDRPPSESDVITGPFASRLIARAARYHGDPEAFVTACEQCQPALLERVEGGIRVRGLDRYDEAWAAARVRAEKARAAAQKRWGNAPSIAQAVLDGCSDDAQPMLGSCSDDAQPDAQAMPQDAQTQTQTQTHTQIKPAAAADQFRSEFLKLRTEVLGETVPEDRPLKPKQVKRLQLVAAGHQVNLLRVAADAYFRDKHWRSQDPPCPLAGFIHPDQLPQFLSKAARVLPSEGA